MRTILWEIGGWVEERSQAVLTLFLALSHPFSDWVSSMVLPAGHPGQPLFLASDNIFSLYVHLVVVVAT